MYCGSSSGFAADVQRNLANHTSIQIRHIGAMTPFGPLESSYVVARQVLGPRCGVRAMSNG